MLRDKKQSRFTFPMILGNLDVHFKNSVQVEESFRNALIVMNWQREPTTSITRPRYRLRTIGAIVKMTLRSVGGNIQG